MRRHLLTLDAMRGVAALAVVLYHADNLIGVQLMPHGYLAVDLFFALSGFVVARAYDWRLAGEWSAARFTVERLIRFWPLYALGLAIGLVREFGLIATHNQFALDAATLAVAFGLAAVFAPFPLQSRDNNLFSINVPSWSLFYELLVNIAYAAAFRWLNRYVIGCLVAIGLALMTAKAIEFGTLDFGARLPGAFGGLARTVFSFGSGVLLFRLDVARRAPSLPAVVILVSLAVAFAVPAQFGVAFDLVFAICLSPAIVAIGAGEGSQPSAQFERVFEYLGIISFPIYAVHRPLLAMGEAAAKILKVEGWILGAVIIGALLIICSLLDRRFDRPIRNYLKRLVGKEEREKFDAVR